MRLLLDTHTLFWFDTEPNRLSQRALSTVRDRQNQVYISAVTAWELAIKHRLGKLPSAAPLLANYHASLARYGFRELSLSSTHALAERQLSSSHKDPFDRALVAQALLDDLHLVSNDPKVAGFVEIHVLW
jgi:PIN domain nuclease of toxin-antitoxin system